MGGAYMYRIPRFSEIFPGTISRSALTGIFTRPYRFLVVMGDWASASLYPCSSLNQFIPEHVCPLACSSYNYDLFIYFFYSNINFLTLASTTNATPVLSKL